MSLAAAIAEVELPRVPGLADQAPGNELLEALRPPHGAADRFFAFQANFKASGELIQVLRGCGHRPSFRHAGERCRRADRRRLALGRFKLQDVRVMRFGPGDGVHHTNFFSHPSIARIATFPDA